MLKKRHCMLAVFLLTMFVFVSCTKTESSNPKNAAYVFQYAHTQSEAHPRSKSMQFFKSELENRSKGKIRVELYFSGILGKESETLDMVRTGTIQGCRGGLFERANKKFLIYTLPFLFEDAQQLESVLDSEFGRSINAGALENGFYIPACGIAGGLRNITTSSKPIQQPLDLVGLRLRTPPIDITIKTFTRLGAITHQIPYTETYLALQKKIVDGQENPLSNIVDMKFYEVQEYLSLLNWQAHPDPFYVNPEWYDSLPKDLQQIFDETAKETMRYSNTLWLDSENKFLEYLEDKLTTNTVTAQNLTLFKNAVRPIWDDYIKNGYFTEEDLKTLISLKNE